MSETRERVYVQERKHRKDCVAVKNTVLGSWSSPWATIARGGEFVRANRAGNEGAARGIRFWVRFRCNDLSCSATVLIELNAIGELAADALDQYVRNVSTPEGSPDAR